MTTSRGRYYRRTQFKRLCQLLTKEYQRRGMTVSQQKIERHILEKTAQEWYESYSSGQERLNLGSRIERQRIFDANYTKKL